MEIPASKVEEEEETQSEQIQRHLKQGFTLRQLTDKLGFKETTVRQEMVKLIAPGGEKVVEEAAVNDGIPMTRKVGSGMEVLNPEAVLRRYTDGSIEDEIELRGMMKLRAAMLMVMDLVSIQKEAAEADARRIRPVLDLMKEAREEQDAAAQRARASNLEIADKAAYETAGQLSQVISQNNTRITRLDRPNPAGNGWERGESTWAAPKYDAVHATVYGDVWTVYAGYARTGTGRKSTGGAVAAAADYATQSQ